MCHYGLFATLPYFVRTSILPACIMCTMVSGRWPQRSAEGPGSSETRVRGLCTACEMVSDPRDIPKSTLKSESYWDLPAITEDSFRNSFFVLAHSLLEN